jgi:hypothetical protein
MENIVVGKFISRIHHSSGNKFPDYKKNPQAVGLVDWVLRVFILKTM